MNVLITGATGLIGARLRRALIDAGHRVVGVARHPPAGGDGAWLALDIASASRADWRAVLAQAAPLDAVVNCVGIFRESKGQRFDALHHHGPARLFDACVDAGIGVVVQVSALGADAHAGTRYHRSKRAADDHLLALPLRGVVAQPSLVFAPEGASARTLLTWAALPLVPLPAGGRQCVQPIAADDVTAALLALLTRPEAPRGRIALVGPEPLALHDYLGALRAGLGLPRAPGVPVPARWMAIGAWIGSRIGRWWPGLLLDDDSWRMLQRGNCADAAPLTALLGRPPSAASQFIAAADAATLRQRALLGWTLPLVRISLALVWIVTAWVSAFVFPVAESFELLARTGVPPALRPAALYGAAALDALFGLATLLPPAGQRWRPWLWRAQAALIVGYMVLISIFLPEFWAHPYGPLLKNLPLLALIVLLAVLEPEARR